MMFRWTKSDAAHPVINWHQTTYRLVALQAIWVWWRDARHRGVCEFLLSENCLRLDTLINQLLGIASLIPYITSRICCWFDLVQQIHPKSAKIWKESVAFGFWYGMAGMDQQRQLDLCFNLAKSESLIQKNINHFPLKPYTHTLYKPLFSRDIDICLGPSKGGIDMNGGWDYLCAIFLRCYCFSRAIP